jgi:diguanylate cyclase (GGDEF)-like protein/PAS domain S-box-containing protein
MVTNYFFMPFLRLFFSHRLILLACVVSLGIGALFARAIWAMRKDEWQYANQTNVNLVRTLEQGLNWALDAYSTSLEGVVREASKPEVWKLPRDLRFRVVFDHSLRTRGAGDVVVTDHQGKVLLDSGSVTPRVVDLGERDYFKAFESGRHRGLFIGKPVRSRVTGSNILPLALPYYHPDGSFAGVVAGAMRLSHFNEFFASLDIGFDSGINLLRDDGLVIARFPYGDADVGRSIAGTANMLRFQKDRSGSFVGTAALDNVERLYSFQTVGAYPLILNVAQSTTTIFSSWTRSAWVMGSFALLLMLASVGLAWLFARELALRQKVTGKLREAEHNLRTILDNMPSMIGYWDGELRNRFANNAYFAWFGVQPDVLRDMHISTLMGRVQFEQAQPYLARALAGHAQLFERAVVDRQGVSRHTIVSYVPDMEGESVRGIYEQVTDITERKRMEDELFGEKERVRLTLQSIGDAVVCTDARGQITYLNPVAESLTGWQAFHAAGRNVDEVVHLHCAADHSLILPSSLRQAMASAMSTDPVRGVVVHRTNGRHYHVEETASPITDRMGHVTGAVAVLRDVSEAVAMAERMARLAQYDALTDLPNRVLLQDRAQVAMAQAHRDRKMLAVMYLDLDGFKAVNDTLGHDVGDQLLVQVARRLSASVRATDTVCRQGGDEFVVLLPGLDSAEPARAVARKMLASCVPAFELAGRSVHVGVSGGIALYPQHGETFDELSRHADTAMYVSKRSGRMRFTLYQGPDQEPETLLPEADPIQHASVA